MSIVYAMRQNDLGFSVFNSNEKGLITKQFYYS